MVAATRRVYEAIDTVKQLDLRFIGDDFLVRSFGAAMIPGLAHRNVDQTPSMVAAELLRRQTTFVQADDRVGWTRFARG